MPEISETGGKLVNNPDVSPTSKEGVIMITKPEGIYTVIYGLHETPNPATLLPGHFDGLFVEANDDYSKDPFAVLNWALGRAQERYFFDYIKGEKIPMYFADMSLSNWGLELTARTLLISAETIIGGKLLLDIAKDLEKRKLSRRDFIVRGVLSIWALGTSTSMVARILSSKTGRGDKLSAELIRTNEKVHPETHLLLATVRNVIMAHKEQYLMERIGGNPNFVTTIGAAHVSIEDQIRATPQNRIEFLQAIKPVLKEFADTGTFYKLLRFDFDGNHWRIGDELEIPELKAIITE